VSGVFGSSCSLLIRDNNAAVSQESRLSGRLNYASHLYWLRSASGDEPLHRTVTIGRPGIAWAMEGLMGVDLPFPTEMENKFLALRFFLIPNHPKP